MRHKDEDRDVVKVNTKTEEVGQPPVIDVGIDLSEFYMSVEWDILQVHYCGKTKTKYFSLRLSEGVCFELEWELERELWESLKYSLIWS